MIITLRSVMPTSESMLNDVAMGGFSGVVVEYTDDEGNELVPQNSSGTDKNVMETIQGTIDYDGADALGVVTTLQLSRLYNLSADGYVIGVVRLRGVRYDHKKDKYVFRARAMVDNKFYTGEFSFGELFNGRLMRKHYTYL